MRGVEHVIIKLIRGFYSLLAVKLTHLHYILPINSLMLRYISCLSLFYFTIFLQITDIILVFFLNNY